ncbi:putative DNA modification/repair radical SAM protein [Peptoniphilus olsenii]|uniref:DNA modification/repair radical SAM protein n=1 Tax=Peptoniphilus olsenii TaxID=411570 RepID=A0ABV2JAE9_9FIRM
MDINEKLKILTDSAKYDVSCSSSGSNRKNSKKGLGNASYSGICHSWSEDGRCISLLKILLSNKCVYDCEYCINRKSMNVSRAEFTPREVANLTVNFYKRNYIEGLFLSSAVAISPDNTMELLIKTAEILRDEYNFNGYIHMKAIPSASDSLIKKLGNLVDRLSVNIELPTEKALSILAPSKSYNSIYTPMSNINKLILENNEDKRKFKYANNFVPAGQTTQMIIGASNETDSTIINRSSNLYKNYNLKRVYYSGYVPVVKSKYTQGIKKPPLIREHRLYQADWLMRYYKFGANEIVNENVPNLDLNLDPKASWAIRNINMFPIEINHANYNDLLRIPGIGPTYALRIIKARKFAKLSYDSLLNLKISIKKAKYFILVDGVYKGGNISSTDYLEYLLSDRKEKKYEQLSFF